MIGIVYQKRGDGTYSIRLRGQSSPARVRKVFGVWRYRLSGEEAWHGSYKTRDQAAAAALSHAADRGR